MAGDECQSLVRRVGVFGAVFMGLGSIVGTGVFVSIGIGAGVAGAAVVLAITVAAVVAFCNGLSSAQLAASFPISGGTYEYGYRKLTPSLGFTAGWMFLCAKSASAATAALGFAGYLLTAIDVDAQWARTGAATAAVIVLTVLVLSGMRRANAVNITIVSVSLASLAVFVAVCLPDATEGGRERFVPFLGGGDSSRPAFARMLEACALMFVAYTGYGRIATLGEEIHNPKRNIPRAIVTTLVVSMLIYIGVALVGVGAVGAAAFADAAVDQVAPLEVVARQVSGPTAGWVLTIGAMTAMLGALLNLVLGLSRVALAMGRRGDLPGVFSKVVGRHQEPVPAVLLVACIILSLVLVGDVKATWSFSAFTVLVYYALTNLCALRLQPEQRLYPRAFAWGGLASCVFLAFWVEWRVWAIGLGLIAVGLVWHVVMRRRSVVNGQDGGHVGE